VRTRNIVLVALTGYGQVEDRETTASYGFLTHLVKPVTSERLDEVFGKVAQARESRERLPAG
jgi:CheY-like chemotaxis protein